MKHLWDKPWRCALFSQTIPRHRFLEIMRHHCFDLETKAKESFVW